MLTDAKVDLIENPRPMAGPAAETSAHASWPESGVEGLVRRIVRDDSVLLEGVTGFLASGLRNAESCIVIASSERRRAIAERLGAHGLDVGAPLLQREYFALDAEQVLNSCMVNGQTNEKLFTDVVGGVVARIAAIGRRVRLFEEMVTLLWTAGNPRAATSLEHLWDDLAEAWHLGFFCSYPITYFALEANGTVLQPGDAIDPNILAIETGGKRSSGARLRALVDCRPGGRETALRG